MRSGTGRRFTNEAKTLYEAMERLDPGDGRLWEDLSQREREFYELSLESVFDAHNYVIEGSA